MTLSDYLGLSEREEALLARALQAVLVGLIVGGIVTVNASIIGTATIALAVTLLPAVIRREYHYSMDPGLVLWITVAMILHTAGTLGLYESFQWYDEIAHTVSATLIAGFGYASFRALERHTDDVDVPPAFRGVFIVVFVLAAGMFWEVIEYAAGDLITVYGVADIVTDMIFNAVGAAIVAVWGTGYVDGLTRFFGRRMSS